MADSSNVLAAARDAQRKKVMKGPEIDLDMDKLLGGILGDGDDNAGGEGGANAGLDEEERVHGTNSVDKASKVR